VPFDVDVPDPEQAYLDGLPLSPEAKERVRRFIKESIPNVTDDFRLNPENRPKPDSPYFVMRLVLLDRWGDGQFHTIDFHIRDDGASFGVLLIVYVDHV
jgi:hypothetical protein